MNFTENNKYVRMIIYFETNIRYSVFTSTKVLLKLYNL